MKKCFLVLANGSAFPGVHFGAEAGAEGELVFTTAGTYMGTLTDPCYAGQIVLQTSPLIGNYGVVPDEMDSDSCHLAGYVVKEWCDQPINFQSQGDIDSFLKLHGVAGVCGVDTRQITRILREEGTMRAAIADEVTPELIARLQGPADPACLADIPPCVPAEHLAGGPTVALINCGAPHGAIAALNARGASVRELPYAAALADLAGAQAAVICDGPGGPDGAPESLIQLVRELHKSGVPMLGLGLGHLILARALGAEATKLHHGHRGANQPIRRTADGQVFICSLNQGHAVSAPDGARVTFENVNDGGVAGLDYGRSLSVQFMPDSSLGPLSTDFIYDEFIKRVVG